MKKDFLISLMLISCLNLVAQNEIEMKAEYGVENRDLQTVLRFQNIDFETFTFNGEIINKDYRVTIKEFKNGTLTKTDTMFDSSESEYFKIKKKELTLNFLSKNEDNQLTLQIQGDGFASKKLNYETPSENGKYVQKDFLGSKTSKKVTTGNPFPILGIITPTIFDDGSSSYCEVAQADIEPEKLGERFDIPHYFLIQMQIK